MNRFLLFCLVTLAACGSEKGVETAQPSTFVRYYNGGNDDIAKLVKQTADNGFIILSNGSGYNPFGGNSTISNPYGCKLIKTDEFGNLIWQKTFFTTNGSATDDIGQDLLLLSDGYLLLGSKNILKLDATGNSKKITFDGTQVSKFSAVALNTNSNYLIIGIAKDNSMFQAELDATTSAWNWISTPLGTPNSILNKLFISSSNLGFWCTSINTGNSSSLYNKILPVGFPIKSTSAIYGDNVGAQQSDQIPYDFSKIGNDFLITGSTNEINYASDKATDICYYRRTELLKITGNSTIINLDDNNKVTATSSQGQVVFQLKGNQTGYSISSTQDGGIIILGGVDASNIPDPTYNQSKKREHILIKLDGFGNLIDGWPKYYGSKEDDYGACVIQANDGSIVVLGTSLFGNVKTIMLMKTDRNGSIL